MQQVIKRFANNSAMEVHLLNVQPPFSSYVARFSSRRSRNEYHREQADKALTPVKEMLDRFSIPYAVHIEVGDRARITDAARRLQCDEIVMATARKNSLTRLVESSVTDRVIELTPVPVEVIAGDAMSKWERYGIPARSVPGWRWRSRSPIDASHFRGTGRMPRRSPGYRGAGGGLSAGSAGGRPSWR